MEFIRPAQPARQHRRADDTSSTATSATSNTASTTDSSSDTSSPVPSGTAAATSSITSAVHGSPGDGAPDTITAYVRPPPWTATSSEAYQAPGVNATHPLTTSYSATASSSTPTTTTSSSTYVPPEAAAVASAKAFGVPPNELTACQINNTAGPFCTPIDLQDLWVGFTYSIHWNPDLFDYNATNTVELRYNGTSSNATINSTIWKSDDTPNPQGYIDIEMSKDWLLGASGNFSWVGQNISFFLNSQPAGRDNIVRNGPMISLVLDPKQVQPVRIPTSPFVKEYGVKIGVPVGIIGFLIIVLGIWCGIRQSNRHNGNIKMVGKDYMARRARRRGKGAEIQLQDYGDNEQYTDQPVRGGENAFREEIARQREEDDRSLRRSVTSF